MQWGAQNAAEFADDARIVIIDANKQSDFVARLQVTESSVVIIKRYSNALLQIRRIFSLGIDFTSVSSFVFCRDKKYSHVEKHGSSFHQDTISARIWLPYCGRRFSILIDLRQLTVCQSWMMRHSILATFNCWRVHCRDNTNECDIWRRKSCWFTLPCRYRFWCLLLLFSWRTIGKTKNLVFLKWNWF